MPTIGTKPHSTKEKIANLIIQISILKKNQQTFPNLVTISLKNEDSSKGKQNNY
jgi:hypothetical protein